MDGQINRRARVSHLRKRSKQIVGRCAGGLAGVEQGELPMAGVAFKPRRNPWRCVDRQGGQTEAPGTLVVGLALQHTTTRQPVQQAVEGDAVDVQTTRGQCSKALRMREATHRPRQEKAQHGTGGQGAAQAGDLQARLDLCRHLHGFFRGSLSHDTPRFIATLLRYDQPIAIKLQYLSFKAVVSPAPESQQTPLKPAAFTLRNLTLGYERHPAVHHLSMDVACGSLVAVVGPNGAGKSTLIKALAGQLRPIDGEVHGLTHQRVAWLPQQSSVDRSFPITVQEMVLLGLWHAVGALGRFTAAHRQACHEALGAVGLHGFERRSIGTLSGGQMQRALFARLMLQDAPVVLLDEPFAAVDQRTTDDLLALLHRWHAHGKTVVAVLHDLAQVRAHFPITLLLAREPVAWGATADVLTEANWQRALRMQEPFDDHAMPCETHVTRPVVQEASA